ncbi:MAG TPA: hypothetical protein VM425_18550 [Myxococcota bacterium]|nr:hypothetical protein [Myxococcota bacterium]
MTRLGLLGCWLLVAACGGTPHPAAPPCNAPDLSPGSATCTDDNGNLLCDVYEPIRECAAGTEGCSRHPFGICAIYTKEQAVAASAAGAVYSRPEVPWHGIEKSVDQYDFNLLDQGYDLLTGYGMEPIISLRTKRDWGATCDLDLCQHANECPDPYASCPPADLGPELCAYGHSVHYYDFVTALLDHVLSAGKLVDYVVVENEVNTYTFWIGTDEDYLRTRATAYKATKDFNLAHGQHVKVIDNGIASDVWGYAVTGDLFCGEPADKERAVDFANRFFKRVSDAPMTVETIGIDCAAQPSDTGFGKVVKAVSTLKAMFQPDPSLGMPAFDFMSYHFYAPWDTQEEVIDWIKRQMQANGYERPIICSEGGFDDPHHMSTDDAVASELVKLHVVALASGVEKWLWLKVDEKPPEGDKPDRYRSLYAPGMTPLPAAKAYEVMAQKLDGFTSCAHLDLGTPDVFGYDFVVNGGHVYVLWTLDGHTASVDLSAAMSLELIVTDIQGAVQSTNAASVPVTDRPVFGQP